MKNALQMSHQWFAEILEEGDFVVDATVGNGHDTLFLAELVGPTGKVLGFDIQASAIERTRERLTAAQSPAPVQLVQDSHAHLENYLRELPPIKGAIFNLGYLPQGDKSIITSADSTLPALAACFQHLQPKGRLFVMLYTGHPGGQAEATAILHYATHLPQETAQVAHFHFLNQRNAPPELLIIEKKA